MHQLRTVVRSGCIPRWHSERRFWLLCSVQRARFVCISNDGRTSNGCQCTATEMCRSSGRRRINLHFGQHGGRFNIIETSQDRMSRCFDTSTATQVANILLEHRRSCGSSRTKSVWSSTCRIIVGKIVRKSSIGIRMGTSTEFRLFLRASKARSMLIGIRGWRENDWKEAKTILIVELVDEKRWSWWTNYISSSRFFFGMYSTRRQLERKYCWGIQTMFETRNSAGAELKS